MSIAEWRLQIADWRGPAAAVCLAAVLVSCARASKPKGPQPMPTPAATVRLTSPSILPLPKRMTVGSGPGFSIGADSRIYVTNTPAALRVAGQLASFVARSTGVVPSITPFVDGLPQMVSDGGLSLFVGGGGGEGYDLVVEARHLRLHAATPAGLFYGVQTIRQLLPASSEYEAVHFQKPRPATIPLLEINDAPRYQWRGAMLDVARHFFSVDDVKRYIDLIALHKMNRLHLHLADDQGWRIEIKKWPDLTVKGGTSEVGGGPGGFYTQAQYADIVAYAAERFITVVPEIDMPGHTNAALVAYAELNCNGQAAKVFTGTEVGFSALCVEKDVTYRFIDDVVSEIAALTPGPYFHMGGDEVKTLTPAQYNAFVERVQTIVQTHGKQMIGWDEIAAARLAQTSIVQHWRPDAAKPELARAPKLILSPANRTYLDMKYDADTALGLAWAGLIPLKTAYDWDPDALVPGAQPGAILGVEAPLWSETAATMRDVEFLALPRLAAIAEIAWSARSSHDWESFRARLGAQAPRYIALGINFYRSPDVPWKDMSDSRIR
jgi:hexosaminidase